MGWWNASTHVQWHVVSAQNQRERERGWRPEACLSVSVHVGGHSVASGTLRMLSRCQLHRYGWQAQNRRKAGITCCA